MRAFIFYSFMQIYCINFAFSQSPFANKDSLKVNNITYLCFGGNGVTEVNNKNHLTSSITYASGITSESCRYADVNDGLLETSINLALAPNRRAILKNKGIRIVIYVKPTDGIIQEIKFLIPDSIPITKEEVYALEQNLKGKSMYPQQYCATMLFTAIGLDL